MHKNATYKNKKLSLGLLTTTPHHQPRTQALAENTVVLAQNTSTFAGTLRFKLLTTEVLQTTVTLNQKLNPPTDNTDLRIVGYMKSRNTKTTQSTVVCSSYEVKREVGDNQS